MEVTIRDVAQLASVSPMTVSRVMNGSAKVHPRTREKVQQAISELGYVPNGVARQFSSNKTATLALLVPDIANPFFTLVARGAGFVASQADYRLILCNTEDNLAREYDHLQSLLEHRVDGLVIAAASDKTASHLRLLQKHGLPFVLVDRAIEGIDSDLVQGDSLAGARCLVEHLIGLGHRSIAIIAGPQDLSTARDRVEGYRVALVQAGIELRTEFIVGSDSGPAGGFAATQELLKLPSPPTAIFAVNNLLAVGVVQAARERRLNIPEDVALVCFDDLEHASILCPFLTVMAQPAETFGTIATQLLLERIAGRATERPRRVVLPAAMLVRRSSGSVLQIATR